MKSIFRRSARLFALCAAAALLFWFPAGAQAQTANPLMSGVQPCMTAAAQLPNGALTTGVLVSADATNTGTVFVGGSAVSTANGYPLSAGASVSVDVTSLSMVWVVCQNTTDVIHFIGH